MRYTIDGILQSRILELKLSERERKLLEFISFVAAGNQTLQEEFDGKRFFWLNYKKFIAEYPYLEIPNTEMVGKCIKSLVSKGLVVLYVHRSPKGVFSFIHLTTLYYSLWSSNPDNYNHSKQGDDSNSKSTLPESQLGSSGDKIRDVPKQNSGHKNQPTNNRPNKNHKPLTPLDNTQNLNLEGGDLWSNFTNNEQEAIAEWNAYLAEDWNKPLTSSRLKNTLKDLSRHKTNGYNISLIIQRSIASGKDFLFAPTNDMKLLAGGESKTPNPNYDNKDYFIPQSDSEKQQLLKYLINCYTIKSDPRTNNPLTKEQIKFLGKHFAGKTQSEIEQYIYDNEVETGTSLLDQPIK